MVTYGGRERLEGRRIEGRLEYTSLYSCEFGTRQTI